MVTEHWLAGALSSRLPEAVGDHIRFNRLRIDGQTTTASSGDMLKPSSSEQMASPGITR